MVRKRPIKPDPISAGKRVTHVCCLMYQLSKVGEKPARVTAMRPLPLYSICSKIRSDAHSILFKTKPFVWISDWRSAWSGKKTED